MSDRTVTLNIGGIFIPLLTILFIGLKLTDYIDWSWWWVLSPMWIPMAIVLGPMAIVLGVAAIWLAFICLFALAAWIALCFSK